MREIANSANSLTDEDFGRTFRSCGGLLPRTRTALVEESVEVKSGLPVAAFAFLFSVLLLGEFLVHQFGVNELKRKNSEDNWPHPSQVKHDPPMRSGAQAKGVSGGIGMPILQENPG